MATTRADRPLVLRALSLMRMPGYQAKLRERVIFLLERRVEYLTREILSTIQERKRVIAILNEMKQER